MDADESQPLLSSAINHSEAPVTDETPPLSDSQQSSKCSQYIATISATIGAFAIGTALGWSSPVGPKVTIEHQYGFPISDGAFSWISSVIALGAATVCFPSGLLMNKYGRKTFLLFLMLPSLLGWCLILFAADVPMIIVGRFILGMACGGACVAIPAYIGEISDLNTRGILGAFFQLMITLGVFFAYALGNYIGLYAFNIVCTLIPIVFGVCFYFMPESPISLVSFNKIDQARGALKWLRGPRYNVEYELNDIVERVRGSREDQVAPFRELLDNRVSRAAFLICVLIMTFQQLSGINAILFNSVSIFMSTGVDIGSQLSAILVAGLQFVATFASTFLIERLGRRVLLLLSSLAMVFCLTLLGLYFYMLRDATRNVDFLHDFSWLPLLSLCVYIVTFSIGFGPIPWLVTSELCTANIKPLVCSSVSFVSWTMAFLITVSFDSMKNGIGNDNVFWCFSILTLIGSGYVYMRVPETKGRSLSEILSILDNS